MGKLFLKIHAKRRRHSRYMASALELLTKSDSHIWGYRVDAITCLIACGCPRSLWPEPVRGMFVVESDGLHVERLVAELRVLGIVVDVDNGNMDGLWRNNE